MERPPAGAVAGMSTDVELDPPPEFEPEACEAELLWDMAKRSQNCDGEEEEDGEGREQGVVLAPGKGTRAACKTRWKRPVATPTPMEA